jgi:aminoglycoside phosphotransferase (APT) family kinase protein
VDEQSLGGNLNEAVRVGDTVRRRAGPWTSTVHELLRFLEAEGFPAPHARGIDAEGREILEYIEGDAYSGHPIPLPDAVFAEEQLIASARLLRRYHDLVTRFEARPNARWRLVSPEPHEVICHNDWTPWNAIFRDGRFLLTVDWDLAGPGPRIWDVANAAAGWVPLVRAYGIPEVPDPFGRLRLFCDAYGLDDRASLLTALRDRTRYIVGFIAREARSGDPGMQKLDAANAPARVREDLERFIEHHRAALERALA